MKKQDNAREKLVSEMKEIYRSSIAEMIRKIDDVYILEDMYMLARDRGNIQQAGI